MSSKWWGKAANNYGQVLLADLKACRNLDRGKQIHAEAVECGEYSIYVANALIDMYAKCGSMVDASQVFDSLRHPTVVSWTALILGFARNEQGQIALDLFAKMKTVGGPSPNFVTFVAALKACTTLAEKGVDKGKAIHHLAFENGCNSYIYVQNALIDMYGKCGSTEDARQVLNGMKHPDVISWNALILGYADNGEGLTALEVFTRMKFEGPGVDYVTLVGALKACASLSVKQEAGGWTECRDRGKAVHQLAAESGYNSHIYVQSTLVDMYAKSGSMIDAHQVFDSMQHRNAVSWAALILGSADNGQSQDVLKLFTRMRSERVVPNLMTYSVTLKACGLLGALDFGRTIHSEIHNRNDLDVVLVTCLVDFYAKCDSLVEAQSVFDLHAQTRDLITWNALLAGYSNCGDNEAAFGLFKNLQDAGLRPDGITFTCILTCCSHAGLVEEGKNCFDVMSTKYGIVPTIKHYTCMVDLFARANKLDDAMALLQCMPYTPDNVTWKIIMSASKKWKNVEIGKIAFQSLINLNDRDAAAYVLMGQIYESRDMLLEHQISKKFKAPEIVEYTCWTNQVGEVHKFLVEDIHEKWELVTSHHSVIKDVEALCGHSERLALAYALINTDPGKSISIVKNLRVCDDCHAAIVRISKMEHRTVICRDANTIHVFKDGKCSCGDFW